MDNVNLGADLMKEALELFGEDSHMYSIAVHGNVGELLQYLPHHIREVEQSGRVDSADRVDGMRNFGSSLESIRSAQVVLEPQFV